MAESVTAVKQQLRQRLVIFTPVLAILVFLLWPLSSRRWDIVTDQPEIDRKNRTLANVSRVLYPVPRIIVILADDLGPTDVGLYGGTNVQTPHIDSIGESGVTFTNATCTSAICAPSRVSMLTGRYQQRSGFEFQPHDQYARSWLEFIVFRYFINTGPMVPMRPAPIPRRQAREEQGVVAGEMLLSELLSARGYHTAAFGKWHMGYAEDSLPLERGFDRHFGFYEAYSLYAPEDDPSIVNTPIDDFSDKHMWRQGRSGYSAIMDDKQPVDESEYLTFKFAELAADYIQENAGEPFFLYLPFNAPHTPLQAPQTYYDNLTEIEDPVRRTYYAMIAALDDAVGTVLKAVDDAGIADSTMIVFASDNGGVTYLGVTDNGPFAGGKFSMFEGGLSVPLMVKYPGTIPEGTVYSEPVSLMDIFPTVANRSGPADGEHDGVDLLPYILDVAKGPPHDYLFWRNGYNHAARTGPWKLVTQGVGAPDTPDPIELLFNLDDDPYETTDVAADHPGIVRDLKLKQSEWELTLEDPAWPPVMHFGMDVWGQRYWFGI